MEKEFVPYGLALKLKELGFDGECIKGFYEGEPIYTIVSTPVDFNNKKQLGELVSAPLWQQAFDWFEEKYGLSGETMKQAPYQNVTQYYWWYQIQDSKGEDVSDWQGRFNTILDKSHQNVEGKYVDDDKFLEFLYADLFAFKTRNSAKVKCLEKLIELITPLKMATTTTAEQLAKEICLREENTGKHLLDVMAIGMHEYAYLQTSELIEAVEKVREKIAQRKYKMLSMQANVNFNDGIYFSLNVLDELLKAHKPTPQ